jgi:hypothetical protein
VDEPNESCPVSAADDQRFRELVIDIAAAARAGSWLDGAYRYRLWIKPADAAFARWLVWLGEGERRGAAVLWLITATDGNSVAFALSLHAGVTTRAELVPHSDVRTRVLTPRRCFKSSYRFDHTCSRSSKRP